MQEPVNTGDVDNGAMIRHASVSIMEEAISIPSVVCRGSVNGECRVDDFATKKKVVMSGAQGKALKGPTT